MAENNRSFSIFLLVLALIGAALFYGCGSASSDAVPAIEYSITGSYNSEGLTSNTSARAVSGPSVGIYIYSEADPTNFADVDENTKTYVIRNLRPGTHYVVFKHIPLKLGGPNYICRSTHPVVLTESNPVQKVNEVLRAVEGNVSITGKVLNSNGQPITPTPTLSLWGQTIEVNPFTGEFTTPKMPEGTTADLIINAVNYKQTENTVTFTKNPAVHEITGVETTSLNVPPTIDLSSKDSRYIIKSLVMFTVEVDAKDNKQLEYSADIECTSPNTSKDDIDFSQQTTKNGKIYRDYYWYSPADDCLATITVTVTAKDTPQNLSSKAKLQIQIGNGQYKQNTKPQILSTKIYPETLYGTRQYTVTCIATDTENDSLVYVLSINPTGKNLEKSKENEWKWTLPDLKEVTTYQLDFEVRDPKGNVATLSRTVSANPSKPNETPYIVSQTPAGTTSVTSGNTVTLSVEAKDPENEKLTFFWISKKGQIIETSETTTNASITWEAPYLNVATTTEITCIVKDPYESTASATFSIYIEPDPNKKAPEIAISISGTSEYYQETIPLFKAGDTITFSGLATDSNKNVPIDPANFTWYIIQPNGNVTQLPNKSSNCTYTTTKDSAQGDYTVRLTAIDLTPITGEQTADFRINVPPTSKIQCNGNFIDSATGRMTATTTYEYSLGGNKKYDVYQINDSINLVASCSDIESTQTMIDNNTRWLFNNTTPALGKTYSPTLATKGLNTITMTTSDSKGEYSATSTYSFFVNTKPVFEIATSSKSGFINTDLINLKAKVNDDAEGLTLTWFISYKPKNTETFSDFITYEVTGNPAISTTNSVSSNLEINASTLMELGTDFKFKLIATDSMGTQTVNEDIGFSIVVSHEIKDFTVASGTYSINQRPYTFDELLPALEKPYVFEANQKFSIRSGSDLWEDAMTWTWSDSFWTNNQPGASKDISSNYVDLYTLNGYLIPDNFGTHTIRLTGKSNEYGIIASKSIDIFINSTPKVEFNNMVDGTIRFDTGSNATFTITLKEDNKNEKLGLVWTIFNLDQNCNETTSVVYYSHDLDPATGNISPVDMAGSNEKNVTINWNKISPTTPLSKGAKRVYVCAYDAYGKAATASVDILVNTLPIFENVVGSRKIKIEVPATSDNDEDYSKFTEQYATASEEIPVFLVAGNPSMQLNFTVNATDAEDGNLSGDQITWKYTDYSGAQTTQTGANIKARFGIGLNTINVECHDTFYNYYKKDGEYVYNNMCIATYSAGFYVWQSMSFDLPQIGHNYTATNLLNTFSNGIFYVVYGNGVATFTERYQLDCGVNTTRSRLVPGHINTNINEIDSESNVVGTETPKIITMFPTSANHFMMLTDSKYKSIVYPNKARYYNEESDDVNLIDHIASYTIINITDADSNDGNHPLYSFESSQYPGSDVEFPKKILSMTYSSSSDKTAGAMILRNWQSKDCVAGYSNARIAIAEEANSRPLYYLDNKSLSFSANSKIRFLNKLPSDLEQRLFITDTNNNRIVRLKPDFSQANSIIATKPIDICTTDSKYIFSLRESGTVNVDTGITLYSIDSSGATPLTNFAKFTSSTDNKERAGKVKNPKSIIYYTLKQGNDIFGGLIILEDGDSTNSRIQVIRSNKADWLE